jgi:hypothetical protein
MTGVLFYKPGSETCQPLIWAYLGLRSLSAASRLSWLTLGSEPWFWPPAGGSASSGLVIFSSVTQVIGLAGDGVSSGSRSPACGPFPRTGSGFGPTAPSCSNSSSLSPESESESKKSCHESTLVLVLPQALQSPHHCHREQNLEKVVLDLVLHRTHSPNFFQVPVTVTGMRIWKKNLYSSTKTHKRKFFLVTVTRIRVLKKCDVLAISFLVLPQVFQSPYHCNRYQDLKKQCFTRTHRRKFSKSPTLPRGPEYKK